MTSAQTGRPASNVGTPWNDQLDEVLVRLTEQDKLPWAEIGKKLGRTGDGCAHRYRRIQMRAERGERTANQRRYAVGKWTKEEEQTLIRAKTEERLTYAQIRARYLPDRTISAMKSRFLAMTTDPVKFAAQRAEREDARNAERGTKPPASLVKANRLHVERLAQYYENRAAQMSAAA